MEEFQLRNPELEAEIYYLTSEEGGRSTPIFTGYRGQFYYDNQDWDAPQQFIDKSICNPGETVKVYLQTLSPNYHQGKFYVGKEFKTREGAKVVGIGRITRIIREDFQAWNGDTFLKSIGTARQPYAGSELKAYQEDFDYHLKRTRLFGQIKYIRTDSLACMLTIECKLNPSVLTVREVGDPVIDAWNNHLALGNQKMHVDYSTQGLNKEPWTVVKEFNLYFATWNERYLTGVIKILR